MTGASSLLRTSRLHREKACLLRQKRLERTLLEVVFAGHPQNQADLKSFITKLGFVHHATAVRWEKDSFTDRVLVRATLSALELQRVNAPGWSVIQSSAKAAR